MSYLDPNAKAAEATDTLEAAAETTTVTETAGEEGDEEEA